MLKNALTFRPSRLPLILGNHVIARSGEIFAGFAHLAPGSVAVVEGQTVAAGEILGRVGHTGNSTAPHLHFQLMRMGSGGRYWSGEPINPIPYLRRTGEER